MTLQPRGSERDDPGPLRLAGDLITIATGALQLSFAVAGIVVLIGRVLRLLAR